MEDRQLYMEVYADTKEPLSISAQENFFPSRPTTLIPATQEQVEEAKNYHEEHGSCKCHLIYDEPGFDFDLRYCGICGAFIGLI